MELEHQVTFGVSIAAGVASALLIVYASIQAGVPISTAAAPSMAIGAAIAIFSLILLLRGWDGATKAVATAAATWSWLWVASMLRNLAYTFRDPHSPLHGVNISHPSLIPRLPQPSHRKISRDE